MTYSPMQSVTELVGELPLFYIVTITTTNCLDYFGVD